MKIFCKTCQQSFDANWNKCPRCCGDAINKQGISGNRMTL